MRILCFEINYVGWKGQLFKRTASIRQSIKSFLLKTKEDATVYTAHEGWKKLHAIKLYQDMLINKTGLDPGLKDAKLFVETCIYELEAIHFIEKSS